MSPRPYQLGKRQGQIDQSRQRVIDGARSLLGEAAGYTAFTVDAVARRADVSRATVYYQFGSKTGLLEALCDHLAEAGRISGLAAAFAEPGPDAALAAFIGCFGRFWAADRLVMRRLRALAALDPEVGAVIASRDERRRAGLAALISRRGDRPGEDRAGPGGGRTGPAGDEAGPAGALPLLYAITSFETFDAAAGPGQDLTELVPGIVQLALAALRADEPTGGCHL